jgi:hypothetical protein
MFSSVRQVSSFLSEKLFCLALLTVFFFGVCFREGTGFISVQTMLALLTTVGPTPLSLRQANEFIQQSVVKDNKVYYKELAKALLS